MLIIIGILLFLILAAIAPDLIAALFMLAFYAAIAGGVLFIVALMMASVN
jgi:hypothetical protein